MRSHQPLHPTAQIAIFVRLHDKMEMVGHETAGQHIHGQAGTGLAYQADE